jgi:cold-inducible RNA-binding protein
MASKLYVGNLAYSVSNDDLRALFSQVGQVQSATVITDKFSGQSKGFGFVEMTTAEEVANAIQQFNETELKGRNIRVNEAKPRESGFGGGTVIAAAVEGPAGATAGEREDDVRSALYLTWVAVSSGPKSRPTRNPFVQQTSIHVLERHT